MAVIVLLLSCNQAYEAQAQAKPDPIKAVKTFAQFRFAKVVPVEADNTWGILYVDNYNKMQLFKATSRGLRLEWKLASLGAPVVEYFYADVEGDGRSEILIATVNGRVLIYDAYSYQNTWENLSDPFDMITAMQIADIDEDPQLEIVLIANDMLFIYDGLTKSRQWVSARPYKARQIIVANVDNDDQLEIILNTGVIVDSKFLNNQVEWDKPFGDKISVFDMNNDGYPEIVGELPDFSLRIFDAYTQREVW
jgi:hypothetical protein